MKQAKAQSGNLIDFLRKHRTKEPNKNPGRLLDRQLIMTLEQWADVPDCPVQRNTEQRAQRAKRNHLKTFSETQLAVIAAVDKNGRIICKLDGHTRSFMFKNNMIAGAPAAMRFRVQLYEIDGFEDAIELYYHFDNKHATETTSDLMYGAASCLELDFRSTLLKKLRLSSALSRLEAYANREKPASFKELDALRRWTPELHLFDETDPKPSHYNTGLTVAALLSFAKDGNRASGFWKNYNANQGVSGDGRCDAVQALSNAYTDMQRTKSAGGSGSVAPSIGYAIQAYNGWCRHKDDYRARGKPRLMDLETIEEYAAEAIKRKRDRMSGDW